MQQAKHNHVNSQNFLTAGFSLRLLLRLSEKHLKMAVGACIQLDASNEMKLITAMKKTTATVSTGILERQKLDITSTVS